MPPPGLTRLLATLRWIAGAQSMYDAPDSRDRARVLEKRWALEGAGTIALTDEGRGLLAELETGAVSKDALRLALSTSASYRQARHVLELSGDYASSLAWIVARQADGRPLEPEEPLE